MPKKTFPMQTEREDWQPAFQLSHIGGIPNAKPSTDYAPDKRTERLQHPRKFDITPQERNVSLLVAEGKTNSEIAATLYLTSGTVRNYVSSILSKLYLPNRAALAVYVVQHGLINPGADRSHTTADPDCYKDLAYLMYS